jgi:hypothetical protein
LFPWLITRIKLRLVGTNGDAGGGSGFFASSAFFSSGGGGGSSFGGSTSSTLTLSGSTGIEAS